MTPGFLLLVCSKIQWVSCVCQLAAAHSQACHIYLEKEKSLCLIEDSCLSSWRNKWKQLDWHIHNNSESYADPAVLKVRNNCFWDTFSVVHKAIQVAQRHHESVQVRWAASSSVSVPDSSFAG